MMAIPPTLSSICTTLTAGPNSATGSMPRFTLDVQHLRHPSEVRTETKES